MSARRRSVARWAVGAAILTASTGAFAQKTTDQKAAAEALFRDARKLFAQNKFVEACAKFEESQRLDPSPGTLVNLATCHEKEGKLATAWSEFKDVLARASVDSRPDREKTARERISAIEPKLGKLTIEIAPAHIVPGLIVTRGGVSVTSAAFGTAIPVDAGRYPVQAAAPGYEPWEGNVEVSNGKEARVAIPHLVKIIDQTPAIAKVEETPSEKAPPPPTGSRFTLGLVAGGVGVVGLGVGGFFGFRALSQKTASDDKCVGGCTPEGAKRMNEAFTSATFANIGIGVGIVGIGVGTYLLATSGSGAKASVETRRLRVAPAIGTSGGGVAVGGTF